jgi:hypothetical protein
MYFILIIFASHYLKIQSQYLKKYLQVLFAQKKNICKFSNAAENSRTLCVNVCIT